MTEYNTVEKIIGSHVIDRQLFIVRYKRVVLKSCEIVCGPKTTIPQVIISVLDNPNGGVRFNSSILLF